MKSTATASFGGHRFGVLLVAAVLTAGMATAAVGTWLRDDQASSAGGAELDRADQIAQFYAAKQARQDASELLAATSAEQATRQHAIQQYNAHKEAQMNGSAYAVATVAPVAADTPISECVVVTVGARFPCDAIVQQ